MHKLLIKEYNYNDILVLHMFLFNMLECNVTNEN